MSGIEILGIAAAVLQIADLGGKLSVKLFTFSRKIKSADKSIRSVSQDIAATGAVLQQLATVLKKDEKLRLCSDQAIETAKGLVADCKAIFSELDEALDNHGTSGNKYISAWKERLKFPFIEPQIELLQSNLERLKGSLVLMLNVLIYAEQLRNHEAMPILKEQRNLIQILVDDRNSSCKKFNQMQNAIQGRTSPPVRSRGRSPSGASFSSEKAVATAHEQELQHHGILVETLMKEINASRYQINHGIRYRMHQGVLRAHWDEWSSFRKRFGHGKLMKLISLHSEVSQYWLSKLETETPVQDDPSGIIPVLSNPPLFDTSGKGSNDLPPYEKEGKSTDLDSQPLKIASTGQFSRSGSTESNHTPEKALNDGATKVPTKLWIPPPPPTMQRTGPPHFLPPPPSRIGVSTYNSYPATPGLPTASLPLTNTPSIISSNSRTSSVTVSLDGKLQRPSEVSESVGNSKHGSAGKSSEQDANSDLDSRWSMDQVTTWLKSNSFSEEWVITFKNLGLEGPKFLDLALGPSGRGNLAMMHQFIYPELARVCTSRQVVWNQSIEREEGKRLRKLLARDADADYTRWSTGLGSNGRTAAAHQNLATRLQSLGSDDGKAPDARFTTPTASVDTDTDSDDDLFAIPLSQSRVSGHNARAGNKPSLSAGSQGAGTTPYSGDRGGINQPGDGTLFGGSLWAVRAPLEEILQSLSSLFPKYDAQKIHEHEKMKPVSGQVIGVGTKSSVRIGLKVDPTQVIAVKQIRVHHDENATILQNMSRKAEIMKSLINKFTSARRFRHENLVQLLGYQQDPDNTCLNIHLEYVSGGSIGTCLRAYGRLEESVIKSVTSQSLAGLCYLHQSDSFYGEIKADNILLDLKGVCKLTISGFGHFGDSVASSAGTRGPADDIWYLGCMVLEMYSGRRAISVDPNTKVGSRIEPRIPEDVVSRASPEGLDFMMTCFTVNPRDRPTGAELVRASPFCAQDPSYDFAKTDLFASLGGTGVRNRDKSAAASGNSAAFPLTRRDAREAQSFGDTSVDGTRLTFKGNLIDPGPPLVPVSTSASSPRIMTATEIMRMRHAREARRQEDLLTSPQAESRRTDYSALSFANEGQHTGHDLDARGSFPHRYELPAAGIHSAPPPPVISVRHYSGQGQHVAYDMSRRPRTLIPPPPPPLVIPAGHYRGQGQHIAWEMARQSSPLSLPPPPQNDKPMLSATYIPQGDSFGPGVGIPEIDEYAADSRYDSNFASEPRATQYRHRPERRVDDSSLQRQDHAFSEQLTTAIVAGAAATVVGLAPLNISMNNYSHMSRSTPELRDEGYTAGGGGDESEREDCFGADDSEDFDNGDDVNNVDNINNGEDADIDTLLMDWTTLSTDEVKVATE